MSNTASGDTRCSISAKIGAGRRLAERETPPAVLCRGKLEIDEPDDLHTARLARGFKELRSHPAAPGHHHAQHYFSPPLASST